MGIEELLKLFQEARSLPEGAVSTRAFGMGKQEGAPVLRLYPLKGVAEKDAEAEALIKRIQAMPPKLSWVDPNRIEYHAGFLVVLNSEQVHQKIIELMKTLR